MEFKNLFSKIAKTNTNCQYWLMPVGFEPAFVERINSIINLPRETGRNYRLHTPNCGKPIDVLLINHDNPSSLSQKNALLNSSCPNALVVTISQGPIASPPEYHLRGLMTASRLLGVLDPLPLPITPGATPETKAFIPTPPPAEPQVAPTPHVPTPTLQPVAPQAIAPTVAQPHVTPPPNPLPPHTDASSGYKALVVDDSIAIQTALKQKLQSIDKITTIDFADSGQTALDKAMASQYDLIFLDVMMPGMDGYEACTRLRKMPNYKKTPIIMVSGKTSPLDEVKGVMAGCTTYLSKPVDDQAFHKLSLRVLNWLADRKAIASTQ